MYGGIRSGDADSYAHAFVSKFDKNMNEINLLVFWERPCSEATIYDIVEGNDGFYYAALVQYGENLNFLAKLSKDLSEVTYLNIELEPTGYFGAPINCLMNYNDYIILGSDEGDIVQVDYSLNILNQNRIGRVRIDALGILDSGEIIAMGPQIGRPTEISAVYKFNINDLQSIIMQEVATIWFTAGITIGSNIYVAGSSNSNTGLFEGQNKGDRDMAVIQLDSNLDNANGLLIGGSSWEDCYSIAYDGTDVVLYGSSMSSAGDGDIPSNAIYEGALFPKISIS